MKIAGVVVLYNPDEQVKKNILTYIDYVDKLFIVDNSDNDNKKKFCNINKKIVYTAFKENKGIAYALNYGAQQACEEKFNWLLTMDQDSCFKKSELEKLIGFVKKLKEKNVGIVSPWHVTKTGESKPESSVEEVVEVMTSGNLVSLKAFKEVNGFKEWLFIDDVDIEFCMNLNKNGYKVIRYNDCEMQHNLGDIKIKHILTRNFVCSNHNYIRRYYMIRNMFYVTEMYKNTFPDYCHYMRRGAWGSVKNIIIWEKDKFRKIRNMWRGYRDFKRGVTGKYPYNN